MRKATRSAVLWLVLCAGMTSSLARAQVPEKTGSETQDLAWRDSELIFDQSLGANTFSRSSQLSYDPSYTVTFDLRLYWHFSERTKLRLQQALEVELTDSDSTLSRQRPLLSDTDLRFDQTLVHVSLSDTHSFEVTGGLKVIAPTSLASQAAGLLFGAGPRLGAALTFKDWLQGTSFYVVGGYLRRVSRGNTVRADVPYPCFADGGASSCEFLGSLANPRDLFEANFVGQTAITDKLSALLWLRADFAHAYGLGPAQLTTDSGSLVTLPDESTTHWRNSRQIYVAVSYALCPFVTADLTMVNVFAERSQNGNLRAPLRPVDTVFGIAIELLFDQLYVAVRGKPAQDVGSKP